MFARAAKLVFILNFCNFFPPPGKKFSTKCRRLAMRELFRVRSRDIVVSYDKVPERFLQYVEEQLGFSPAMLYPKELVGEKLSLLDSVTQDYLARSVTAIAAAGRQGYKLDALMQHRKVVELSELARIPLADCTDPDQIVKGSVEVLNSKTWAKQLAMDSGIRVPAGPTLCDLQTVAGRARRTLLEHEAVMLRLDLSAGGLGNCIIRRNDRARVADILFGLNPQDQWQSQPVLVEPFMSLKTFGPGGVINGISCIFQLDTTTPIEKISYMIAGRVVIDGTSCGAIAPYKLPAELELDAKVEKVVRCWMELLREAGYVGHADIDLGVDQDNEIVFFEVNARRVATEVQLNIAGILYPNESKITLSNEDFGVYEGNFDDLLNWAEVCRTSVIGARVVVTIPPGDEQDPGERKAGIVIIGDNEQTCWKAHSFMVGLASKTLRANHFTPAPVGAEGKGSA